MANRGPTLGSITVHGVTRVRIVHDIEHNCLDLKLEGDGGAFVGGPSITLFGADVAPVVTMQNVEESEAEMKRSARELLDSTGTG